MKVGFRVRRGLRLVRRETAESHLYVALLSFAVSVSAIRLFLTLTGYPQVGGGELHIAHVLWGGLLLFAASLLPLVLSNRWVYTAGAALAGLGVGLFIDEVGKFITQHNDYFHPVAAPIIYTFFLLTILLLINLRRIVRPSTCPELSRALEDTRELIDHSLTGSELDSLQSRLEECAAEPLSDRHADLARALLRFVETAPDAAPARSVRRGAGFRPARVVAGSARNDQLRLVLAAGILAVGLLTLKNPAHVLLGPWLPPDVDALLSLSFGRQAAATLQPTWSAVRVVLELVLGSALVASAAMLVSGRASGGATLAFWALFLSLTSMDLLLFYFEQFSTVITTTIQFILLMALVYYRRRLRRLRS